jgi:ribosomal protein L11 methyltransferase
VRTYPAIDVRTGSPDIIAALVDDFEPTALEERSGAIRVFFSDATRRDAAAAALSTAGYEVQVADVDDEDWARRSQEGLSAVTVDRVTVSPPWAVSSRAITPIVIQPSMGFGTGHHPTTRLCLRALQRCDLTDRFVLDVATGSGVLAIAAARLGAARALGVDHDADAIESARENLALNAGVNVDFRVADLAISELPRADVVTANLTGTLLVGSARRLRALGRPGARWILSGLLEDERDAVIRAFSAGQAGSGTTPIPNRGADVLPTAVIVWEAHEDGWVGLVLCCN